MKSATLTKIDTKFSGFLKKLDQHIADQLKDPFIPTGLADAMRYVLHSGGKRLRPLLVFAVADHFGASIPETLAAAAAVEYVHTYSLVHDDLPAMDNDDFRRGKPSCHKAFNEATAILCGDALLSLAFENLTKPSSIKALAKAIGPAGMVGGQYLDLFEKNNNTLADINALKTAKLFEACAIIGAELGTNEKDQIQFYAQLGFLAGTLYQIQDDLQDQEDTLNPAALLKQLPKELPETVNA